MIGALIAGALAGCGSESGSLSSPEAQQERLEWRLEQRMPRLMREYQAGHPQTVPRSISSKCEPLDAHNYRCRTFISVRERGERSDYVMVGHGYCDTEGCDYQPLNFRER